MISYFVNTLAVVVFVLFHWYDYPCLPTAKAIWPVHASSQVQAIGYRETYSNSGKRHWLNITKTKKWLYICWYLLQHSFLVRCQIKKFYESLHCFRQQYHCVGYVCVCVLVYVKGEAEILWEISAVGHSPDDVERRSGTEELVCTKEMGKRALSLASLTIR